MLAFIASNWFIALPSVLTGYFLLRVFNKARAEKEKESRKRVPVHVRKRK